MNTFDFYDHDRSGKPRELTAYYDTEEATEDSRDVQGTDMSVTVHKVKLNGRDITNYLKGSTLWNMGEEIKEKIQDE